MAIKCLNKQLKHGLYFSSTGLENRLALVHARTKTATNMQGPKPQQTCKNQNNQHEYPIGDADPYKS